NPSTLLHKISEIYDRIAFAGVGKYNEFENLRIAGIRHADVKAYSYSRGDVTAKALANAYSQALGNIFTQDIKPFEVEVLVAEVAEANGSKNEIYHILYDGTIEDEHNYAAMGGQADEIRRFLKDHYREGLPLGDALGLGVRALTVTQNKTLSERDLEVAVLDRTKVQRKFRRIPLEALGQLRSEEHTSELQSRFDLVCRLLLEKKNINDVIDFETDLTLAVPTPTHRTAHSLITDQPAYSRDDCL